ncbi:hypothetical protein GCM10019016_099400 [Streptomyces prasinosporus]|uniref:SMP-30/Gluconolactonase/LRE-like region domain-containing protein n=1 Tax=Streptomyces prasinosporus TaxID=68256 RepID=A0ABP6U8N2_9ACTN
MHPAEAPATREIRVADEGAGPYGITAGPDGALWLTLVHRGRIARLTLDGGLEEHPLDSSTCRPAVITPRARRRALVHPAPGPPDRPHHRQR